MRFAKDNSRSATAKADAAPILPDGRIIDSKNTLQSHSTLLPAVVTIAATATTRPVKIAPYSRVVRRRHVAAGAASLDLSQLDLSESGKPSAVTPPPLATAEMAEEEAHSGYIVPHGHLVMEFPDRREQGPWWRTQQVCRGWGGALLLAALAMIVLLSIVLGGSCATTAGCWWDNGSETTTPTTTAVSLQERERALWRIPTVQFINDVSLTGQNMSLLDSSIAKATVEERAMDWLVRTDPMQLIPDTPVHMFRLKQRYAVATLWAQFNLDTGNTTSQHECTWPGIKCRAIDGGRGIGTQDAVTEIRLPRLLLRGSIGIDLGLLTSLEHLDMSDNLLSGRLPATMGLWTEMVHFTVANNELQGTLPGSLAKWTNLTHLAVNNNALAGTLPEWIGNWTLLIELDVGQNRMLGPLPTSIGAWSKLEYFHANDNHFSGTLPSSLVNWTSMRLASIEGNGLQGWIPSGLCYAVNLTKVSVACGIDFIHCGKNCFGMDHCKACRCVTGLKVKCIVPVVWRGFHS